MFTANPFTWSEKVTRDSGGRASGALRER